jgi:photosystem II stability/assembly factor-like uncharacterized protein
MKKFSTTFAALILSFVSISQVPSTWYNIQSGTTNHLRSIDFPSSNTGYIVGDSATILKTTDGGQTWVEMPTTGIQINQFSTTFWDVDFVDDNVGFLSADYNGLYKTTDGGQTWSSMVGQVSNMCFHYAVYPFSANDFIAGGSGCFQGALLDHFENGTWTTGNLASILWDSQQHVTQISFANANVGLAATKSHYMLRTTDGGANWDTIPTSTTGFLTSVVMVDEFLCYAGYDEMGSGLSLMKSTDGGLTWQYDVNTGTFYYPAFLSVHASPAGDIYSGAISTIASGGLIFETSDGTNWSNTTVDQPINGFASSEQDITFGVGDNGLIIVNTAPDFLGTTEFDLQNFKMYPNPASNELIVHNPLNEINEVFIYDLMGSQVITGSMTSGANTIDISTLSTGVYSVRLQIGNKFQVNRLVKD